MAELLQADQLMKHGGAHTAWYNPTRVDYHFRRHGHQGYCEWTLVLGGSLEQEVAGQRQRYGPGDLIFIREGVVHELWGQHLEFANAPVRSATLSSLATACGATDWLSQAEASAQPPVRRLGGEDLLLARACFRRATSRRQPSATMQLVSTLLDLMTAEGPPAALPEWLRVCLTRIDAELEEGLTVADLPSLCDRSAAHIARSFRAQLGCTPSSWLNRRRCERAAVMLVADAERPLVDIALALGFASQSYFTRCFDEVFGLAPGRYRNQGAQAGI
jgi:AraC family cel operon transcriptional repressor